MSGSTKGELELALSEARWALERVASERNEARDAAQYWQALHKRNQGERESRLEKQLEEAHAKIREKDKALVSAKQRLSHFERNNEDAQALFEALVEQQQAPEG